jgi:hypothetical protein
LALTNAPTLVFWVIFMSDALPCGLTSGGCDADQGRIGQLGPDVLPVVGTKHLACNYAASEAFDVGTLLDRYSAHLPVSESGNGYIEAFSQHRSTTKYAGRRIHRMLQKLRFYELHDAR